jgi:hypothetical protein
MASLQAALKSVIQVRYQLEDNELAAEPLPNFFAPEDETLLETLACGEFGIRGFQNKDLRRRLPDKTSGQISRTLKHLRVHGIVKKVGRTYRYYLTNVGRRVILAASNSKNCS